jgi:hypothetical protein
LDALGQGEGTVRHHACGIVEEGDQVGLAPHARARQRHAGAVHHVTHPQLARVREGEAPAVLVAAAVLGGALHQPGALQQPVHGRGRGAGRLRWCWPQGGDQLRDRQVRLLFLEAQQRVGRGLRQRT